MARVILNATDMRYAMELSYAGGPFHGWQTQPNASSVQEDLESALATVLRQPVSLTGAGRTDTGVNARMMVAHFDTDTEHVSLDKLKTALNRLAGPSISIKNIRRVSPDFHARFDAISRTYKYFVAYSKSPFLGDCSWLSPAELDVEAMNGAADLLIHTSDFTSFAKLHSDAKTNICNVTEARWERWENSFGVPGIVFTIKADRFLRNMVRAVVGTLVDVGRGKLSVNDFQNIINKKDRCAAGTSMPPQGLFLWDIAYPDIEKLD